MDDKTAVLALRPSRPAWVTDEPARVTVDEAVANHAIHAIETLAKVRAELAKPGDCTSFFIVVQRLLEQKP